MCRSKLWSGARRRLASGLNDCSLQCFSAGWRGTRGHGDRLAGRREVAVPFRAITILIKTPPESSRLNARFVLCSSRFLKLHADRRRPLGVPKCRVWFPWNHRRHPSYSVLFSLIYFVTLPNAGCNNFSPLAPRYLTHALDLSRHFFTKTTQHSRS